MPSPPVDSSPCGCTRYTATSYHRINSDSSIARRAIPSAQIQRAPNIIKLLSHFSMYLVVSEIQSLTQAVLPDLFRGVLSNVKIFLIRKRILKNTCFFYSSYRFLLYSKPKTLPCICLRAVEVKPRRQQDEQRDSAVRLRGVP